MIQDDKTAQEKKDLDLAVADENIEFFDPWQQAFKEESSRRKQEFEF
jgi:hypothetical protein